MKTQNTIAFTIIELLAVMATAALLAMLLLPALAGTKTDNWRAQCQNQMKQLGAGFGMFVQDHNEMFPPAVLWGGGGVIPWDCYIHRYIGGTAPDIFLTQGSLGSPLAPGVTACPADIQPKVSWVANYATRRSYAMIPPGKGYGTGVQIDASHGYPLPVLTMGIGIYWDFALVIDWDAPSYKSSAVKDASGTILLDEEPSGFNVSGSGWPCVSLGPIGTGGWGPLYQIDPNAVPQPKSSSSQNQGVYTYRAHGNRFNYLFHDGHVSALSTNETLGSGTLLDPKGMWTVQPGD